MKKRLTHRELITITSMLFGMFFGAGNIIFPIHMGQLAGRNVWPAVIGFCVSAVGLPILGVAALGISRTNGLAELSRKVGKKYSYFFTCALYLTIGPFFAIPRCATVPFSVGVEPMLPQGVSVQAVLAVFSVLFFAAVLWFSLRPNGILTWVGKVLNPLFLLFLGLLVVTALVKPMGAIGSVEPDGAYQTSALFTGFLEGYNTMDALASLAFGIVVVNVIRGLGVEEPEHIAGNTVRAGLTTGILMTVIYLAVTVAGALTRCQYPISANGGEAFNLIANHYFGTAGALILAIMVTFACLKTAVGLVTSCAETFVGLFPKGPAYKAWAVVFSVVSLLVANLGLSAIIAYAIPVLMFLYPLAITLIVLALTGRFFDNHRAVYGWVTGLTLIAALFDFFKSLPEAVCPTGLVEAARKVLPFFDLGLGWVCPALLGLVIGLSVRAAQKRNAAA